MENAHYRRLFTQPFRLATSFFRDKKVLDVGCGPRGSLEFLTGVARATVCADPLALNYSTLGAWSHSMVYVSAGIESLPLASNSFDVVSSINNFDHVEDAGRGLAEVYRVLRPGGVFMLAVEIHPNRRSASRCHSAGISSGPSARQGCSRTLHASGSTRRACRTR